MSSINACVSSGLYQRNTKHDSNVAFNSNTYKGLRREGVSPKARNVLKYWINFFHTTCLLGSPATTEKIVGKASTQDILVNAQEQKLQ